MKFLFIFVLFSQLSCQQLGDLNSERGKRILFADRSYALLFFIDILLVLLLSSLRLNRFSHRCASLRNCRFFFWREFFFLLVFADFVSDVVSTILLYYEHDDGNQTN